MPYNLQELQDADALFKAHTQWQQKVLQEKKKGVKAIRVITGEGEVTVLALLTMCRRCPWCASYKVVCLKLHG
jgi:hypothetical protein